MKRIIYLVVVCLGNLPGWLYRIYRYSRHVERYSFEERYQFVHNLVCKINKRARVHLHVYGLENLPSEQGYLMTPNHQGLFDALVMLQTQKKPFKAILKIELTKVIVVKDLIKLLEYLPMDRSNLRASMKVIKEATKIMEEGTNFLIFPEGTRCKKQNQMLDFKGGSFKSVMNAKKPIVPVALIDCYKVFDNNSLDYVHAQVHYLKPLYYNDYKDMDTNEVAIYVQNQIRECIEKNEENIY